MCRGNFKLKSHNGSPRYRILINGHVYKNAVEVGVMRIMHNSPKGKVNYNILL